jgi:hypothetical protein
MTPRGSTDSALWKWMTNTSFQHLEHGLESSARQTKCVLQPSTGRSRIPALPRSLVSAPQRIELSLDRFLAHRLLVVTLPPIAGLLISSRLVRDFASGGEVPNGVPFRTMKPPLYYGDLRKKVGIDVELARTALRARKSSVNQPTGAVMDQGKPTNGFLPDVRPIQIEAQRFDEFRGLRLHSFVMEFQDSVIGVAITQLRLSQKLTGISGFKNRQCRRRPKYLVIRRK